MKKKICIVIPCYRVSKKIEDVIKQIDFDKIDKVFLIDDCCPENTGKLMKDKIDKSKIEIEILSKNLGVGGATIHGFKKALNQNYEIIFKLDGDGQHDPKCIEDFINVFENQNVNFCKGSRFLNKLESLKIPKVRYFGNIALTYLTKKICKIENITDAVNGFIAIRSELLRKIDLNEVSNDYFFEEDLIFKLSFHKLTIKEVPIETIYFDNKSSLNPFIVILPFLFRHLKNYTIRLKYEFFNKK